MKHGFGIDFYLCQSVFVRGFSTRPTHLIDCDDLCRYRPPRPGISRKSRTSKEAMAGIDKVGYSEPGAAERILEAWKSSVFAGPPSGT